jgi:thiamine biosynthesis lipoprotein
MSCFRSMGCEIVLPDGVAVDGVRSLFDERDRRFSRFLENSELSLINATPLGVALVSEDMASMLAAAVDAARATGGLVTPAVGGAILAAGYDRDFPALPGDGNPVDPALVPSLDSLSLRGRMLLRTETIVLDLNGVVKGRTVDDALALLGGQGWVSAGGDLATSTPVAVGLPGGGDFVTVYKGGLATSSTGVRTWRRGGLLQHHLIDPATGSPARTPWRDVTVAAASCLAADVAAKAALLLGHAGPSWLDRRGLAGRFVDLQGAVSVNESWRSAVPLRRAA